MEIFFNVFFCSSCLSHTPSMVDFYYITAKRAPPSMALQFVCQSPPEKNNAQIWRKQSSSLRRERHKIYAGIMLMPWTHMKYHLAANRRWIEAWENNLSTNGSINICRWCRTTSFPVALKATGVDVEVRQPGEMQRMKLCFQVDCDDWLMPNEGPEQMVR